MINTTLVWLLVIPIFLATAVWVLHRNVKDSWIPIAVYAFLAIFVVCIAFFASKGSATYDTEIWNGQVVSKDRAHGTYQRSYECNCFTTRDSKGQSTRHCSTCYEDRYTVKWTCDTTVGGFTIESLDRGSRSVYNTPDPDRFSSIKKGDPAAKGHTYTNYIQAVPNSLFAPASSELKAKFTPLIPKYPDTVYDFYRVNRFVSPGYTIPDAAQWNEDISMGLRERGPKKQVNVIVVVAKTADSNYEYALRDAWDGVNKNDVVVVIGSAQYPKIDFVRILSWTKNESFKVELRDSIMEKGTIDRSIVQLTMTQIDKNFERRHMSEFEYLDGEIDPPEWLVILLLVLMTGGAVGVYFFTPQFTGRRF